MVGRQFSGKSLTVCIRTAWGLFKMQLASCALAKKSEEGPESLTFLQVLQMTICILKF